MTMPAVHPAAAIFPMLPDAELQSLAADIKANGQRVKIVLLRGAILEGRNRWRACEIADVKPRYENHDHIPNPVAFVLSHNLHRRHLDESQRAMVAARMVAALKEELKAIKQGGAAPAIEAAQQTLRLAVEMRPQPQGRAADVAAEALNVSGASVERGMKVLADGVPELVDAVDRREAAVSAAAEVAALPPEKQREILRSANPKIVAEVAQEIRKDRVKPRRPNDAYMSAGGFVRPLLQIIDPERIIRSGVGFAGHGRAHATIIECCAGNGDLAQPLREAGFDVLSNDIAPEAAADRTADATDPETWAAFPPAEWVVSNLPFNEAIRILPHAIKHASVGVAVILRLSFLEPTKDRAAWLHAHPLSNLIVLPRYSFTGDGNTDSVTCAWCVWMKGQPGAIYIPMPDGDGMPGSALQADVCLDCGAGPGELHGDACDDAGARVPTGEQGAA